MSKAAKTNDNSRKAIAGKSKGEASPAPVTKRKPARARARKTAVVEYVDPPARPDPRRTFYADDPDKSFRFTPERRARFLTLIRATMPLERVCERIACSPETPDLWMKAGKAAIAARERGETLDARAEEQAAFAAEYADALTERETILLQAVHKGARDDWRAAAWRLACLRPQEYSERYKTKIAELDASLAIRTAEQQGKELSAAILREKLEGIREARKAGGQVLVIGADDLVAAIIRAEDLPLDFRERFVAWITATGFKFVEARDLGVPSHVPGGG